MRRIILWLPVSVLVLILAVAAFSLLSPADTNIRSHLIGKPMPVFSLPQAVPGKRSTDSRSFDKGQPRVLNIFASWCIPCVAEAPQLMELARRGVPIDAIAIRDKPKDIAAFLQKWGDPYRGIGLDSNSRVQFALGSSGVPETFVIDGKGVIRHQHIGDIRPEDVESILHAYRAAR